MRFKAAKKMNLNAFNKVYIMRHKKAAL